MSLIFSVAMSTTTTTTETISTAGMSPDVILGRFLSLSIGLSNDASL